MIQSFFLEWRNVLKLVMVMVAKLYAYTELYTLSEWTIWYISYILKAFILKSTKSCRCCAIPGLGKSICCKYSWKRKLNKIIKLKSIKIKEKKLYELNIYTYIKYIPNIYLINDLHAEYPKNSPNSTIIKNRQILMQTCSQRRTMLQSHEMLLETHWNDWT